MAIIDLDNTAVVVASSRPRSSSFSSSSSGPASDDSGSTSSSSSITGSVSSSLSTPPPSLVASSNGSSHANRNNNGSNNNSNNKSKRSRRRNHTAACSKQSSTPQSSVVSPHHYHLTLTEMAQYVALDCEMVGVGVDGLRSAVARVTLVNWHGQVLLDDYVRPSEPVTDYRTHVSGITAAHLYYEECGGAADDNDHHTAAVAVADLNAVCIKVKALLEGKILIGHGLKNDLKALRIQHPWYHTRDTAKYEPFQQVRFTDGVLWPRKLAVLAAEHLDRRIQHAGCAHSPIEDAVAALDLYKKVRRHWEKVMAYKIAKTQAMESAQVR